MEEYLRSPALWIIVVVSVIVIVLSYCNGMGDLEWYKSLKAPWGVVNNNVFGVVWGILYVLLIVGGVVGVTRLEKDSKMFFALIHCVIMILTLVWIYYFFNCHYMGYALAILLLILACTLVILSMVNHKVLGTWLPFVCYFLFFLWILVASYYNLGYLWLNTNEDKS